MGNINRLTIAVAAALCSTAAVARGVVVGQVDTFADGTTQNWSGGASPTIVATGGPRGAGDAWLRVTSDGGGSSGGRLITYNRSQWLGNYAAAGVTAVTVDLMDVSSGGSTLSVRLAFKDGIGPSGAGYASTAPFILPTDHAWHLATFPLTASAFTAVNAPAESFTTLLARPFEFRILSSAAPALDGDTIAASLGIDDVTAVGAVPEPAMAALSAVAAVAALGRRRRR